ncbi:hypothetical protein [Natronorubrum sp. DTA28]|uniref:hypothetical protein n=1 Tax=Natronorubrum sp. DTA28 TaxID=3447019 RepID=UPI003F830A16
MSKKTDCANSKRRDSTRRTFLGAVAGSTILASSALGTVVAKSGPNVDMADFSVEGRKITTVKITPSEVEVTTKKQSPQLQDRYGKSSLEVTQTHERPEPERDDLPREDNFTETEEWKDIVAMEDEWAKLTESDNADQLLVSMSENGEIGPAASYPSEHPKYYHNNEDNMFTLSGPINLVGSVQFSDADDCASTIASNGTGSYTWTTSVTDATRYAMIDGQFESHDESVASGPFGFTGRTHGRLWDSGTQVLIAAHEDDTVPHEAVSYLEAEERIDGFMDSFTDHYDVDNAEDPSGSSLLDHNGKATLVFDSL